MRMKWNERISEQDYNPLRCHFRNWQIAYRLRKVTTRSNLYEVDAWEWCRKLGGLQNFSSFNLGAGAELNTPPLHYSHHNPEIDNHASKG